MRHRHLDHENYTLAAIDDVIARGKWQDWADLRRSALDDPAIFDRIERVCRHRAGDPYAQRHRFWMNYAEARRPPA